MVYEAFHCLSLNLQCINGYNKVLPSNVLLWVVETLFMIIVYKHDFRHYFGTSFTAIALLNKCICSVRCLNLSKTKVALLCRILTVHFFVCESKRLYIYQCTTHIATETQDSSFLGVITLHGLFCIDFA